MQIVRTTFRSDGTPISKTLTIQGGSTALVVRQNPKDVEDDEDSPQTKIGRTTGTLKARMTQFQTSHHAKLLPLLDVEGDYEGALHKRFADYRVRGEWFDLTPLGSPVKVVIDALADLGLDIRTTHQEKSAADPTGGYRPKQQGRRAYGCAQ
ncbi:GIY-YIG nuclease family protein [Streptomyces sp. JHA26]|uniref:GIY-YIG nuclease family protein n=1 Tax=Streptomyces sp. JHA26 TaxID=1917143 RepID=UPI00098B1CD4|nr:GIY-YIG nuclease family protein [Streptomyces sp. JHA26]